VLLVGFLLFCVVLLWWWRRMGGREGNNHRIVGAVLATLLGVIGRLVRF